MNSQRQIRAEAGSAVPVASLPVRSGTLQRKCACGGMAGPTGKCAVCRGRHLLGGTLQTQLRIGQPGDRYEQEADRVADAVMRLPEADGRPQAGEVESDIPRIKPLAQRQVDGETSGAIAPPIVNEVLRSPGRPLDGDTRAFFGPRFGHNFSQVRVHTDAQAAESARLLDARAYTVGNDVVFGHQEYAPAGSSGRYLLAHELTHVMQQERSDQPVVRRISYGTGTPPNWRGRTLTTVPADERTKVNQAIAMVDEIVNSPDDFSECHGHFAERCPNGGPGTLASVWGRARLWRITRGGGSALARGDVSGPNIAYTRSGYDQSVLFLAQTLMHESGHNCGIPGGDTHWRAEQIATYCTGTGRNRLAFYQGGPYFGASGEVASAMWLISYRRLLGDWASGHLNLTLGADLNFVQSIAEIVEAAQGRPQEQRIVGEYGSAMVGLEGRLSPWGGPRFGGLTGRIETGFGAGRFLLRPADPSERRRTSIEASWVLQIGVGAEFALPNLFTEGQVVPLTVQAAYRLVQPLNSEAQRMHGVLGGMMEVNF